MSNRPKRKSVRPVTVRRANLRPFVITVPKGTVERLALVLSGEKSWRGYSATLRHYYRRNVVNFLHELRIVLDEGPEITHTISEGNPAYVPLKLSKEPLPKKE